MRIVMTLVAHDEADIVDAHVRYHLAAGVDLILATDHRSTDGTTEILRRYERDGRLRLFRRDEEEFAQSTWVTEMARLAAREHGAGWVINSDADEFWWPRAGTLRDVFDATPPAFGAVRGLWRNFVLRPDSDTPFYERMTVRRDPSHDFDDVYAPHVKVAHRADPDVVVVQGNHDARGERLRLVREWFPFEILHFPIRSRRQLERKYSSAVYRRAVRGRVPRHTEAMEARIGADADAVYSELVVDERSVAEGLRDGRLHRDERLRSALSSKVAANAVPADELQLAQEIDVFLATDAARKVEERTRTLAQRQASLEQSALTHLLQRERRGP